MNPNPLEKRLRNQCSDRISDLPDSILGKILSYLPVEDVIATSILSTRWKPLFPSSVPLTQLFLDDSCKSGSLSRKFAEFVDRLLNVTLRDASCVEKVGLNCENKYGDDKIVSWVCAVLRMNVKHLHLGSKPNDSRALFDSLHGCTTLVELGLGDDFELRLPEECILPNLKRLSLYSLLFRDDMDSIHELLDCCPVLHDLFIVGCDLAILDTFYIQHPFINTLFIEGCRNQAECRVLIDAPNLRRFAFEGNVVANYVLRNIKSLYEVSIDFDNFGKETDEKEFECKGRRLAKLVTECSSATWLGLIGNSVMALYRSCVPLPTFQNLTGLTLFRMGSHGWRMLARFLRSAPNLTVLTFGQELEFMGAFAGFKSKLPSVPICLELRLKKIEIWKFEGTLDEIKLIEYFLKNGRELQELIVHSLPCQITSNIGKLSVLPRHSEACKVLVMEGDYPGNYHISHNNWF